MSPTDSVARTAVERSKDRRVRPARRLPRGAIVVGTLIATAVAVWAAAGDLDGAFGTGGVITTAPALPGSALATPFGMAVQPVGGAERYLVTGGIDNDGDGYADDWYVAAYTSDGALDPSFGPAGTGVVRVLGTTTDAYVRNSRVGMAVDPQGRILRVGTSALVTTGKGGRTTATPALTVARLTPDGRPDTAFNGTGVARVAVSDRYVNGVVVLSSGRIVVVGTNLAGSGKKTWERVVLAGFTDAGALDGGFGSGGVAYDTEPSTTVYFGVGVQSGNRIVVGSRPSSAGTDGNDQWLTTRFTPNGALDTTFGSSGRTLSTGMGLTALAVEPATDAIVTAGTLFRGYGGDSTYNHLAVARQTAAGALDSTYGQGGLADVPYAGANVYSGLTVETLGNGVVAAGFQVALTTGAQSTIARLTALGTLDSTFGNGGLGTSVSGFEYCTATSSAGLLMAGRPLAGPPYFLVARYRR